MTGNIAKFMHIVGQQNKQGFLKFRCNCNRGMLYFSPMTRELILAVFSIIKSRFEEPYHG